MRGGRGGGAQHPSEGQFWEIILSILTFSRGKNDFDQSCSLWCQKLKKNRLWIVTLVGGEGVKTKSVTNVTLFFFYFDGLPKRGYRLYIYCHRLIMYSRCFRVPVPTAMVTEQSWLTVLRVTAIESTTTPTPTSSCPTLELPPAWPGSQTTPPCWPGTDSCWQLWGMSQQVVILQEVSLNHKVARPRSYDIEKVSLRLFIPPPTQLTPELSLVTPLLTREPGRNPVSQLSRCLS